MAAKYKTKQNFHDKKKKKKREKKKKPSLGIILQ